MLFHTNEGKVFLNRDVQFEKSQVPINLIKIWLSESLYNKRMYSLKGRLQLFPTTST